MIAHQLFQPFRLKSLALKNRIVMAPMTRSFSPGGVVTEAAEIKAEGLASLTDGLARALLVEEFNRILISRIILPGFTSGIRVFEEKDDLLPFEEAKLYGHNAVHAMLLQSLNHVEFAPRIGIGIGEQHVGIAGGPGAVEQRGQFVHVFVHEQVRGAVNPPLERGGVGGCGRGQEQGGAEQRAEVHGAS